eukprot:COSAG05_NODE_5206_length_1236_cov_1.464380_2_plen_75_part_00
MRVRVGHGTGHVLRAGDVSEGVSSYIPPGCPIHMLGAFGIGIVGAWGDGARGLLVGDGHHDLTCILYHTIKMHI